MSIPIDDNTRFSMNTDSYVLEHRVKAGIRPDGKPNVSQFKWIIEGYYPSVASQCSFPTLQTHLDEKTTVKYIPYKELSTVF